MGFPTSHQPRSCITPNFPKLGVQIPKFVVFAEISTKALKLCYKVLLSKNFQRQSCSAINCLSNGINILAGDDSVLVNFGPKGTDFQ